MMFGLAVLFGVILALVVILIALTVILEES